MGHKLKWSESNNQTNNAVALGFIVISTAHYALFFMLLKYSGVFLMQHWNVNKFKTAWKDTNLIKYSLHCKFTQSFSYDNTEHQRSFCYLAISHCVQFLKTLFLFTKELPSYGKNLFQWQTEWVHLRTNFAYGSQWSVWESQLHWSMKATKAAQLFYKDSIWSPIVKGKKKNQVGVAHLDSRPAWYWGNEKHLVLLLNPLL